MEEKENISWTRLVTFLLKPISDAPPPSCLTGEVRTVEWHDPKLTKYWVAELRARVTKLIRHKTVSGMPRLSRSTFRLLRHSCRRLDELTTREEQIEAGNAIRALSNFVLHDYKPNVKRGDFKYLEETKDRLAYVGVRARLISSCAERAEREELFGLVECKKEKDPYKNGSAAERPRRRHKKEEDEVKNDSPERRRRHKKAKFEHLEQPRTSSLDKYLGIPRKEERLKMREKIERQESSAS